MNADVLERATRDFAAVLAAVDDGQAGLPTPCAGWSVADLIDHVIAENGAFARALPSQASPATDEASGSIAADSESWERSYRQSAQYLVQRFAGVEDDEARVRVAGVAGERPVRALYQMQVADTLIHTWDLAAAAGLDFDADPTVLDLALIAMRQVPEQARGAGKPFGPAREGAADSSGLEELLRLSGRDPHRSSSQSDRTYGEETPQ
jgi:uncharacterized protein (TIGR03086 family)